MQSAVAYTSSMIISIVGYKGGVGKTTTAVHLACYLQMFGSTLLVDGDDNRSCLRWAREGKLPIKVIDEKQTARFAKDYEHIVIDSEARPNFAELTNIAEISDLLIVPTSADDLAVDALRQALEDLQKLNSSQWKILQTMVMPKPNRDAEQLRTMLDELELPHFQSWIRFRAVFKKATAEAVPVYELRDPRAQESWEDYKAIGAEIIV